MRLRILFGMILLLVGLGLYAIAVMRVAVLILPDNLWIETFYYLILGTVWIYPAAKLTGWMQDLPDPPSRF